MDLVARSWASFAASVVDVANAGLRLLEDEPGVPGVAFLATTGPTGLPRIHPFIPAVATGRLWAFVVESPKQRDLDRTEQFAMHSRLGPKDESFYCAGSARRVDGDDTREVVGAVMPFSDIDDGHVLYEFLVARALWTAWTTPTSPVHRMWAAEQN